MLRISEFVCDLLSDDIPVRWEPVTEPVVTGPVVVWTLTRRCNLSCRYCYAGAANMPFPDELTTDEALAVLDDLQCFGVRALILSGGEPLLRRDCLLLASRAKRIGLRVALSSGGTLLDERMVAAIAPLALDYIGISVDGIGATHDRIRGQEGAFAAALAALQRCRKLDLKVGLRFTMTKDNYNELPAILDLVESEGIDRFYFSHLNYAGRNRGNQRNNIALSVTRRAVEHLFGEALRLLHCGRYKEFVTGNNDADGVCLLLWVQRYFPSYADHIAYRLRAWGGNASGIAIANIDSTGNVHPDTMWRHHSLGNVRVQPFSHIWRNSDDPMLAALRVRPRPIKGRCGRCRHLALCNGNTRVRAWHTFADPWAEDPGCYLTDAEIA